MKTLLTILIALTIGANAGTSKIACDHLKAEVGMNLDTLKMDLGNKKYLAAAIASVNKGVAVCNFSQSFVDSMVNNLTAGYTRYNAGTN